MTQHSTVLGAFADDLSLVHRTHIGQHTTTSTPVQGDTASSAGFHEQKTHMHKNMHKRHTNIQKEKAETTTTKKNGYNRIPKLND